MWIRVCRYKNAGVAGYAEAFIPVQSDSQTSEWYSYFENDVLVIFLGKRLYLCFRKPNIKCKIPRACLKKVFCKM